MLKGDEAVLEKKYNIEYIKAYNNAKRTYIKLSVTKEEYALFMQSVQKAGITCTTSTYLKKLVNEDFTKRGLDPIFKA